MQTELLLRKLDDNMENCRGKGYGMSVGKVCSIFGEGKERKGFFYLQVMWKRFSFLPLLAWIIIDSPMGNG